MAIANLDKRKDVFEWRANKENKPKRAEKIQPKGGFNFVQNTLNSNRKINMTSRYYGRGQGNDGAESVRNSRSKLDVVKPYSFKTLILDVFSSNV